MNLSLLVLGALSHWAHHLADARPSPCMSAATGFDKDEGGVATFPYPQQKGVTAGKEFGNSPFGNTLNNVSVEQMNYFITHFEGYHVDQENDYPLMGKYPLRVNRLFARAKRKAIEPEHFWPFGIIPYEMTNSYSESEQREIYGGMTAWEEGTCIHFVQYNERVAKQLGHSDRLYINKRDVCTSFLGRRVKGRHLLSACPQWTYTMVHELGHAVGMRHQHQTPDRDRYIDIHWDNIEGHVNLQQSFGIVRNPSLYDQDLMRAVPYDINSIMHYPFNAFSKHFALPTITVKGHPNQIIDWRTKPSFYDLKLVNLMYKCDRECAKKMDCQNGGYQDPNDCYSCLCPPTHWGKFCDKTTFWH